MRVTSRSAYAAHYPSAPGQILKLDPIQSTAPFGRAELLRGVYIGRLLLVTGILVGAMLVWRQAQPAQTFAATTMFLLGFGFTSWSFWRTHIVKIEPGEAFLYTQVLLDVFLVTAIVHITGGQESNFAPLYILVISEGALLLALTGGMLMAGLASIVYFADLVWFHGARFAGPVGLQIVLFSVVALATGFLGDRLRKAGQALGAVESELRQLRLDTGDILATISTGVMTVDGDGRLAYLNPAGEVLLGIDARQWLGAPVVTAVEAVAPGLGTLIGRSVEAGAGIMRFKTTATRASRRLVLGVSTAVLERADGGTPAVTAIFQDITDQERIDVLNRRTERLEAVAELSASLAHEIKNPLASIRSAVEQLARDAVGSDDRQLLQRLVLTQSDRLARLLSEFIDFSALRLGPAAQVDLAALVRDAVELVRQQADGVTVEPAGLDRPRVIPGDADLLHRAVFNLLLNAVQFAGSGGVVNVNLAWVGASEALPGIERRDALRLVVRDSGPGVEATAMGRIFDPFYTTRPGGTGMGLAVVHRAVAEHEGAVFVDRAPSGGAEFTIFLPDRVAGGVAVA